MLSKGEVFVVDTDAASREQLSNALRQSAYDVICFADGASLLLETRARMPACVLLEMPPDRSALDVLKRNEGSAGLLVTTSKTDERSFKTTIRNGHDFPIRVAIEDQLPVSENEDIVVEMLPATTTPTASNIRDKRGVLEWSFDAKPGEIRDINFAWRVRWPKDKSITIAPAG